jgi:Phosphoserine phosphatase RsbU, N-terminal domain
VTAAERVRLNYRAAFLRYLARREEAQLHAGYEIGRSALSNSLSILELAQIHHEVLLEVLKTVDETDIDDAGSAASEFLVEVLACYDMAQRGPTTHA